MGGELGRQIERIDLLLGDPPHNDSKEDDNEQEGHTQLFRPHLSLSQKRHDLT